MLGTLFPACRHCSTRRTGFGSGSRCLLCFHLPGLRRCRLGPDSLELVTRYALSLAIQLSKSEGGSAGRFLGTGQRRSALWLSALPDQARKAVEPTGLGTVTPRRSRGHCSLLRRASESYSVPLGTEVRQRGRHLTDVSSAVKRRFCRPGEPDWTAERAQHDHRANSAAHPWEPWFALGAVIMFSSAVVVKPFVSRAVTAAACSVAPVGRCRKTSDRPTGDET